MRLPDYRRREVFFRHVVNECAAADTPFAFFTVDPETGMYAAGNSRFPNDAEFRKVWKECVVRLGEATAHMRKPKLAANQEKLEQQAAALSQRIEQVSTEVTEELDDLNAEEGDSTGASA
jgi:hypothetical protein